MNKGKLIVIEGADGCGKGTLVENIKKDYPDIVFYREPGSTKIGEEIRKLILDPDSEMSKLTEAYLYASSRAELTERILKDINSGKNVICERYYYSSLVYQGLYLGDDIVKNINKEALLNLKPDQIFYLKVNIDNHIKRTRERGELDRIEKRGIEYFNKVIKKYDSLLKDNSVVIDTNKLSKDEVYKEFNKNFILNRR